MKKVLLLTGVNADGYGEIEAIQEDDINKLLMSIFLTDKSQCVAIVTIDEGIAFYTINVNRTALPFRSI